MQLIPTPDAPKAIGPYVEAIACDDRRFTPGRLPLAATGARVAIEAVACRLR